MTPEKEGFYCTICGMLFFPENGENICPECLDKEKIMKTFNPMQSLKEKRRCISKILRQKRTTEWGQFLKRRNRRLNKPL